MVINGKAQALHGGSNSIACGVVIRRLAILGIALTAAHSAATGGPLWEKPSLCLGSLDIDGGLRQRFELGALSGSPEFAFPIYMEHGIRPDDRVSEYRIPQLETYVVPEGLDEILWLEPGGIRHIFKTEDIVATAPARQKEPWLAIKTDAGNAEFRSADGWTYAYDALNRYTLISVNDEPKVHYDYDPKTLRLERKRYWNGWIVAYESFEDGHPKSIVATDNKGKTVTDCHYVWSQNGKLDQRILNGLHHQYKYDPLGRLTEVIKTEVTKQ
jgi:hypothetical protein